MTVLEYVLFALIVLFVLSAVTSVVEGIHMAWKGLETMGYRRTPTNMALYAYCQIEAAMRINMEEAIKIAKAQRNG